MKTFDHIYKYPDGRFFRTPTMMDNPPPPEFRKIYHPIITRLRSIRPGFQFFFSRTINRYILYRFVPEAKVWVHIHTCDNGVKSGPDALGYREPGEWLYTLLRSTDLTVAGTVTIQDAQARFDKDISRLHPILIEHNKKYVEMMYNMNLEFETYMRKGRYSFILGRGGRAGVRRKKSKTEYFVNNRTGQIVKDRGVLPKEVKTGFGFIAVGGKV